MQKTFKKGYLTVDDKMINIKGEKKLSLIAKDRSGNIVHEELLDYIQQDRYDDFLRFTKLRLIYQFQSITTDLDQMLSKAIRTVLPESCPHQLCHAKLSTNDWVKFSLNYV